MRFLVTGSAGFIGFHLARRLLADGHDVHGVDGLTDYYDRSLKERRHALLAEHGRFTPHVLMLEDGPQLMAAVAAADPEMVVHLAAQAGVLYSLANPRAYVESNIVGTFNLLEALRQRSEPPKHLLLASTSSVYGGNEQLPFAETDRADLPLTIYASSKKATELIAHSHAHLYVLPTTVLRFFTVYGPWGRPDMALFKFVDAILKGEPIEVRGAGAMTRDFTYVGDLVESICRLSQCVPIVGKSCGPVDSLSPVAPYRVVNIGGERPVGLLDFVAAIERALECKAVLKLAPMQPGEVRDTDAKAELLQLLTGYRPSTPLADGVAAFCDWYRSYYEGSE